MRDKLPLASSAAIFMLHLLTLAWFCVLFVTTQDSTFTSTSAVQWVGWPLPAFYAEIEIERATNNGFVENFLDMLLVGKNWTIGIGMPVDLFCLAAFLSLVPRFALFVILKIISRISLIHVFAFTVYCAWYIWSDLAFMLYRDMSTEILLSVYARRSTWIFVLAACFGLANLITSRIHRSS